MKYCFSLKYCSASYLFNSTLWEVNWVHVNIAKIGEKETSTKVICNKDLQQRRHIKPRPYRDVVIYFYLLILEGVGWRENNSEKQKYSKIEIVFEIIEIRFTSSLIDIQCLLRHCTKASSLRCTKSSVQQRAFFVLETLSWFLKKFVISLEKNVLISILLVCMFVELLSLLFSFLSQL